MRKGLCERADPAIQCERDHEADAYILSQVDICLNKSLLLADCDDIAGGVDKECPRHGRRIFYPPEDSVLPTSNTNAIGELLG